MCSPPETRIEFLTEKSVFGKADGRELDVSSYVCRSRGRKVRQRKTVCRKDHCECGKCLYDRRKSTRLVLCHQPISVLIACCLALYKGLKSYANQIHKFYNSAKQLFLLHAANLLLKSVIYGSFKF